MNMKKPSPAQLAARKKFAQMAKSGLLAKKRRAARKKNPVATSSRSEVRSPTSTRSEVRSPTRTSTSTKADTRGNITVTGGAGAGATTRVTVRRNPMKLKKNPLQSRVDKLPGKYFSFPYHVQSSVEKSEIKSVWQTVGGFSLFSDAEQYARDLSKQFPGMWIRVVDVQK